MPVEYERRDITPDLAAKWLATVNTHNRNLRPDRVASYARDMAAGEWLENGDSIRFDEAGVLLDGQHRLAAIVQADVSIPVLVVTGLPMRTQDTMDNGLHRKLSDVLTLRGETNTDLLAAVIRRAKSFTEHADSPMRGFARHKSVYTTTECLEFLHQHPELRAYSKASKNISKPSFIPAATVAVAYWLFASIDEGDAHEYMAQVSEGANLDSSDPVFLLRKRAVQMQRETGRYPGHIYLALMIKAWNAYRMGQKLTVLSYRSGGASPEPFPEPK